MLTPRRLTSVNALKRPNENSSNLSHETVFLAGSNIFVISRHMIEDSGAVNLLLMRTVFGANVLVAGLVGYVSLFKPEVSPPLVFQETANNDAAMGVVGSFWLAIAVLSAVGILFPIPMSTVLLIQLLYKGMWLLFFALPAYLGDRSENVPVGIASFFAVWVVVLPIVIPFRVLFTSYRP